MTEAYAQYVPQAPSVRIVPVMTPRGFTRAPLVLVFGYLVATFVLFLVWPINWPIYTAGQWTRLIGYVTLCYVALGATAWAGSAGETRATAPLPFLPLLMICGALASALLLIPASYAYTGRPPWEAMEVLQHQGEAYKRLQKQLIATVGERNTIAVLRALAAPLIYAVLPLGIIRWSSIGWIGRAAVAVVVATTMIFSIMRGTDKEFADLFVVGASAVFVVFGRGRALGHQGFELVRRYWVWALFALVFVYFAQGLFTERKEQRLGGYVSRTVVCAADSHVCADLENPWISWLPQRQRFGVSIFILSTCSGFYGLELALEKPFDSAFGVGHSPAALSVYETITGDTSLHLRTFTYRNGDGGWSEEHSWSTLITWIANDVGFLGAIVVLGLIGWLWGLWWREAAAGMSDPAAVLFALATTAMVYLPANNQVLASYDGYVVFAVWITIWLWHRSRRTLSAAVAARMDLAA